MAAKKYPEGRAYLKRQIKNTNNYNREIAQTLRAALLLKEKKYIQSLNIMKNVIKNKKGNNSILSLIMMTYLQGLNKNEEGLLLYAKKSCYREHMFSCFILNQTHYWKNISELIFLDENNTINSEFSLSTLKTPPEEEINEHDVFINQLEIEELDSRKLRLEEFNTF